MIIEIKVIKRGFHMFEQLIKSTKSKKKVASPFTKNKDLNHINLYPEKYNIQNKKVTVIQREPIVVSQNMVNKHCVPLNNAITRDMIINDAELRAQEAIKSHMERDPTAHGMPQQHTTIFVPVATLDSFRNGTYFAGQDHVPGVNQITCYIPADQIAAKVTTFYNRGTNEYSVETDLVGADTGAAEFTAYWVAPQNEWELRHFVG